MKSEKLFWLFQRYKIGNMTVGSDTCIILMDHTQFLPPLILSPIKHPNFWATCTLSPNDPHFLVCYIKTACL